MDSSSAQEPLDPGAGDDAAEILRRWKGKQPVDSVVAPDRGPLTLLKLPVDILRLILNEISTHSRGDLLRLLTVNSTLHNLAASYIYSSFDIVWPDDSEFFPSLGVDALTHGLSTFALGNRFARTIHRLHGLKRPRHEELRNDYPLFTRSFVMANGPSKWTSDSIISTEYGKMLNTLVAISIQRMANLESFKWDMPTGLSSDVFMALASLDDQPDNQPCRLEKVWVRWHDSRSTDNSSSSSRDFIEDPLIIPPPPPPPPPVPFPPDQDQFPSPPSSTPESIGSLNPNPASLPSRRVPYSENLVEYPTFSVLPPLKSITVLEIDQVAYLDELSFLIERSIPVLKELRLSVASKVKDEDFVQVKGDQRNLQQVDLEARWPGESNIGNRRLGGVIGVVLGRVYNLRKHWPSHSNNEPTTDLLFEELASTGFVVATTPITTASNAIPTEALNNLSSTPLEDFDNAERNASPSIDAFQLDEETFPPQEKGGDPGDKVALDTLEISRIPIHTWLCANAFDWTVLTSLTILQCPGQEKLWRALREQHRPTLVNTRPRRSSRQSAKETWQYHLKLRYIHVDVTTFSLMNFLKETLAPNSLEALFLHDRRRSMIPPVPIRQIFAGPIKRQQLSLKKLLLDSAHPDKINNMGDARKMQWALPLETIHYITSGKMSNLRELSVCIDSANMHSFLQRLPLMTSLTSLDIPGTGRGLGTVSSEEVGLQIVDVIALRPEIKLRFLGIRKTRYEVVESRRGPLGTDAESDISDDDFSLSVSSGTHAALSDVAVDDEDEMLATSDIESDLESNASGRATPDDASPQGNAAEMVTTYQLREIFAYDDKVAIFKAKQGKL